MAAGLTTAHPVPLLVQVSGKRVAISASGFKAGVGTPDGLLLQPLGKLGEADSSVWEDLVAQLAAVEQQADIKLQFRDVESKRG
jgi:hypothetical protein